MRNIFITGGGGAGNEAIWSNLKAKYSLFFGDADLENINPIIPKERCFKIPFANDPNFIDSLSELCKNLRIDFLIPCVDEELILLSKNKPKFSPVQILSPQVEYLETMLDKLKMFEALKTKHLLVPETEIFTQHHLKPPYILKPRQGRGSRDVFVVENEEHESFYIKLLKESGSNQKYIVQDRILGQEYTVQMIASESKDLKAIIPVKVLWKKGITIKAITDKNYEVIGACERIHHAIPCKGIYNIQLILTNATLSSRMN